MTILELILVFSIPLASLNLSTTLIHGFALLISLFNGLLSYYSLFSEILGGLFQTTLFSQSPLSVTGSLLFLEEPNLLFFSIPIIIYSNADTDKLSILSDNKDKAGIYQWTNLESGKKYIGSALDLSRRLKDYYSISYLTRNTKSIICNALVNHGYSKFSLTIIEYVDISNLSKNESKELILRREQHYLDTLEPEYNILKFAGNSLGYKHLEESLSKMSLAKSGESNPMFNKKGEENHMFGKKGKDHPIFGTFHTKETKLKMSIAKGTPIHIYSFEDSTLVNSFPSARKAGEFFNVDKKTIISYAKSGKVFKGQWTVSTK